MPLELGPFTQTRFLGASITSISCNLGWNEQTSTVSVGLVEDIAGGDSFTAPSPGTPCLLAFGDFSFAGIVQSWERKRNFQGNPVYEVTVTDPRELLQGCYIILGGYNGAVTVPNLFNAYGYLEQFSFGASEYNEAGMPLRNVISAASAMMNSGSPYGGPYIRFRGNDFIFDFSTLPQTPFYYRLDGDSMSIMEIISQVCSDSACDFIINMTYSENGPQVIGLKLKSTSEPSVDGAIASYINSRENATSKSAGLELRNEICNVFVSGGEVEDIFTIEQQGLDEDASIWPYWGLDANGNAIIGTGTNNNHKFTADTRGILVPGVGSTYEITVGEIRAALKDQQSWMFYICLTDPEKAESLGMSSLLDISLLQDHLKQTVAKIELQNTNKEHAKNVSFNFGRDKMKDLNMLYELVRGYGTEFYGKKYMVRVPSVLVKVESETQRIVLSHEPVDSGWPSSENRPLNIPEYYDDIFTDQSGKFVCFVGFSRANRIDISKVSPSDAALDDNRLYIRADLDQNFVYVDAAGHFGPRAVITLSSPVNELTDNNQIPYFQEGLKLLCEALDQDADDKIRQLSKNAAGGLPILGLSPATNLPSAACVPLRSNILTYGPWYTSGIDGKVRYEKNSSLVPWNFGGYMLMNYAGNAAIANSLSLLQVGETGTIEIAGLPELGLGDELVAGGPNVTGIDMSIGTEGVKTSYRLRTYTPSFGQFSKQNADRFQKMARGFNEVKRNNLQQLKRKFGTPLQSAQRVAMYLANGANPPNVNTPHEAVISKIVEVPPAEEGGSVTYKTVTTIGTMQEILPGLNADDDNEYKNTALCTLDVLFKPYSTNHTLDPQNTDNITRIQEPTVYGTKYVTSWSYYPFGEPSKGIFEAEDDTKGGGIDATFLANQPTYPDTGIATIQDNFDNTDARGICLAGPLIISGWGLDIFGRPIPGYYEDDDNIPADLSSDSDDVWDKYINNYRKRPDLWKTGPVDLVWCPIRKVWTSNPMYLGTYKRDGKVRIPKINSSGYVEIAVNDRLNNAATLADGTPVIVASIMGEFMIMSVGCVGG